MRAATRERMIGIMAEAGLAGGKSEVTSLIGEVTIHSLRVLSPHSRLKTARRTLLAQKPSRFRPSWRLRRHGLDCGFHLPRYR